MIPLTWDLWVKLIKEEESRVEWWLPGAGGGEDRGLVFNGHWILVWGDERVLEMDGGDGGTTKWINIMPINCTFKND